MRESDLFDAALRERVLHTLTRELMRPSDYSTPRALTRWPTRETAPRQPVRHGAIVGAPYAVHALALGAKCSPGTSATVGEVLWSDAPATRREAAATAERDRTSAILERRAMEYERDTAARAARVAVGRADWLASE